MNRQTIFESVYNFLTTPKSIDRIEEHAHTFQIILQDPPQLSDSISIFFYYYIRQSGTIPSDPQRDLDRQKSRDMDERVLAGQSIRGLVRIPKVAVKVGKQRNVIGLEHVRGEERGSFAGRRARKREIVARGITRHETTMGQGIDGWTTRD